MREVTILELLLAIAMSEFYKTTHVLFLPPRTTYVTRLADLKRKKYIEVLEDVYYKVSPKGRQYIIRQETLKHAKADKEIDDFVENL